MQSNTEGKAAEATKPIVPAIKASALPLHMLRYASVSPRTSDTFSATVADTLRDREIDTSLHPTSITFKSKYEAIRANRNKQRLADFQNSGLSVAQHKALVELSKKYRSYFVVRPVNQLVANANLLCMLLGVQAITKAMALKQKSAKDPSAGGFLRIVDVTADQVAKIKDPRNGLGLTPKSMRIIEKDSKPVAIELEVPLSFIKVLYAQNRISKPILKMEDGKIYLYCTSNDKNQTFKFRYEIKQESTHVAGATASAALQNPPDWYWHMYAGRIQKPSEDDPLYRDKPAEYKKALEKFEADLSPDVILKAWSDMITTRPEWFNELFIPQTNESGASVYSEAQIKLFQILTRHDPAHATISADAAWNPDWRCTVTEKQNDEYQNILIAAQVDKHGNHIPVTADLDFFAVLPDYQLSVDDVTALIDDARVTTEAEAEFTDGKVSLVQYFTEQVDLKGRYENNALEGFGTRAEGDLISAFNYATHRHQAEGNTLISEVASRLQTVKASLDTARREESTATSGSRADAVADTASRPAGAVVALVRTESTTTQITSMPLSAHHGPETCNPKPEPLEAEILARAPLVSYEPSGDWTSIQSISEILLWVRNLLELDTVLRMHHRIPCNAHWNPDFVAQVRALSEPQGQLLLLDGKKILEAKAKADEAALAAVAEEAVPVESSDESDHEAPELVSSPIRRMMGAAQISGAGAIPAQIEQPIATVNATVTEHIATESTQTLLAHNTSLSATDTLGSRPASSLARRSLQPVRSTSVTGHVTQASLAVITSPTSGALCLAPVKAPGRAPAGARDRIVTLSGSSSSGSLPMPTVELCPDSPAKAALCLAPIREPGKATAEARDSIATLSGSSSSGSLPRRPADLGPLRLAHHRRGPYGFHSDLTGSFPFRVTPDSTL
jgi:hypothetical protein